MIKARTPREKRAVAILAEKDAINKVDDDIFAVKSQTGGGRYRIEWTGKGWKCNCPDYIKRGGQCKHILATRYYLEIQQESTDGIQTERIHLTYKQAWSAYNAAQTQEIELFDQLLKELVSTVSEPEQTMGRPRLPLSDQVFCAVMKTYSQLSSRRAHCLFRRAEEREQVSHAPHFNAVSKTLLKEEITPLLCNLIRQSALPLAGIETNVAVDSTGFRCSTFGAYCKEKHGTKRQHNWLKAHICSGVKTNIVTDVVVTDGTAGDSPQFDGLVRRTSEGFTIAEVTADPAYSSRANYDTVGDVGGQAYIPFKSNATGRAGGSVLWKKAYHFFQLHREEFDEYYHKRSNVESTIGAIKQKFGETLKSKNRVAQENELLCKILAYNITVLIHEMFESGITPDFLTLKSDG